MANNDINAEIVVDLDNSSVTAGARDITRTTTTMSQRLTRNIQRVNQQFRGMNQSIQSASNGLIGFGAKIAAVYGGSQAIKMVWEYNDGLKDSARRLGWNAVQIEAQKQAMFDVGMQYGLITSEMSQYVNEVMRGVQTTEEFEDKLKLGAIAMRGLALSGADAAKFVEALDGAGVSNPEFMMNRFANMGQAKNGRFKADEIAMATVDIMGNGSLANDQETMIQIGSMLQALSAEGGSIADATNQLNSIINDMSSSAFREFAKERTGTDVFDVQDNKLVLKDLQTLIDLMAEDTKNGEVKNKLWYDQWLTLQGRLSADSATGIQSLAGKGDAINRIGKSQGISAEQTALDRARNFDASMSKLMTAMQRFADMNLADPIEKFALAMSQLDPSDIQNLMNEAKKAADIIGVAFAVFAGAKTLDAIKSINIKGGGTIAMSIAVGKLAIDYLADKANESLDNRVVKNESDMDMLYREVIQKYSSVIGEKLPDELVTALSLKVNEWNKNGLHQNNEDMVMATYDFLKEKAAINSHNKVLGAKDDEGWKGLWNGFAWPENQLRFDQPEKNLDIINRGKIDFKEGVDIQQLQQDIQKAIEVRKNIDELKSRPQEVEVRTKVDVNVSADQGLKVKAVSKESTVNTPEKLGYTGGGDY